MFSMFWGMISSIRSSPSVQFVWWSAKLRKRALSIQEMSWRNNNANHLSAETLSKTIKNSTKFYSPSQHTRSIWRRCLFQVGKFNNLNQLKMIRKTRRQRKLLSMLAIQTWLKSAQQNEQQNIWLSIGKNYWSYTQFLFWIYDGIWRSKLVKNMRLKKLPQRSIWWNVGFNPYFYFLYVNILHFFKLFRRGFFILCGLQFYFCVWLLIWVCGLLLMLLFEIHEILDLISIFEKGFRVWDRDKRIIEKFEEILKWTFPKYKNCYFPKGFPETISQVSLQN